MCVGMVRHMLLGTNSSAQWCHVSCLLHCPQGVLQWAAVEAAITAGCSSCMEILDHITSQHELADQTSTQQPSAGPPQPQPEQQQQQQQTQPQPGSKQQQPQQQQRQLQGRVRAGNTHACLPLVTREHLQRQLKAWVDEGKLIKVARNCFTLPQQFS
jgi:hypothetical protein